MRVETAVECSGTRAAEEKTGKLARNVVYRNGRRDRTGYVCLSSIVLARGRRSTAVKFVIVDNPVDGTRDDHGFPRHMTSRVTALHKRVTGRILALQGAEDD